MPWWTVFTDATLTHCLVDNVGEVSFVSCETLKMSRRSDSHHVVVAVSRTARRAGESASQDASARAPGPARVPAPGTETTNTEGRGPNTGKSTGATAAPPRSPRTETERGVVTDEQLQSLNAVGERKIT